MSREEYFETLKTESVGRHLFIKRFKEFVSSLGEFLFEPIEDSYILDMYKVQGYWAGVRYRVDYDTTTNEFSAQPRLFGGA